MNEKREFEYFEKRKKRMGVNIVSVVVFAIVMALGLLATSLFSFKGINLNLAILFSFFLAAFLFFSPRVANQWEKAILLRLGKFVGLKGPGLFWVFPFFERTVMWIDLRVRTTGFAAEKTLTSDTVPVNVDAVLFWTVSDPKKTALEVEDYEEAVAWAAQTALRDVIGKTNLATMLVGREHIDEDLKKLIDARTHDWGINVHSVEIRDVVIPEALEDAMSRQAQAEREKQARIILGDAELEIADKFAVASEKYVNNPIALQLRSLNLLYEGMKESGSLMIVPSNLVESMNLGTYTGLAAMGIKKDEK